MSLFAKLDTDATITAEKDSVGGGGFMVDSNLYGMTIEMAYAEESSGGALGVTFHLKTDDGALVRMTEYVTSGRAKGQLNTYLDKDGKKQFLPGYNKINSACLLTVGKELKAMAHAEKDINRYDFDLGKEIPKKTQVLTELLGQRIAAGVIRQTVNKKVKSGNDWVPTAETKDENVVDKFFRDSDHLTTQEILAQISVPEFYDVWAAKNAGVTRDLTTAVAPGGAVAGVPGAAPIPGAAPADTKTSLFQ